MIRFLKTLTKNESGATAIEYGLIAALVSVAAIAALGLLGDELGLTFTFVQEQLESARPTTSTTTP